jgi:hypothetical protein
LVDSSLTLLNPPYVGYQRNFVGWIKRSESTKKRKVSRFKLVAKIGHQVGLGYKVLGSGFSASRFFRISLINKGNPTRHVGQGFSLA